MQKLLFLPIRNTWQLYSFAKIGLAGLGKKISKAQTGLMFHIPLLHGPWWWSSGQHSCFLLQRSEFESYCLLKFSAREDENEKRPGLAHLEKTSTVNQRWKSRWGKFRQRVLNLAYQQFAQMGWFCTIWATFEDPWALFFLWFIYCQGHWGLNFYILVSIFGPRLFTDCLHWGHWH